jgi:hypothetical protein
MWVSDKLSIKIHVPSKHTHTHTQRTRAQEQDSIARATNPISNSCTYFCSFGKAVAVVGNINIETFSHRNHCLCRPHWPRHHMDRSVTDYRSGAIQHHLQRSTTTHSNTKTYTNIGLHIDKTCFVFIHICRHSALFP